MRAVCSLLVSEDQTRWIVNNDDDDGGGDDDDDDDDDDDFFRRFTPLSLGSVRFTNVY